MNAERGQRILVIDDEEIIRDLSGKILERFGYLVTTVSRGTDGIDEYAAAMDAGSPFAAVLLDLTLDDDLSGTKTLARLKELDANVRAIVCSGYSSDPAIVDWSKHGFSGAIVKPFRAEDLAAVVKTVVDRPD